MFNLIKKKMHIKDQQHTNTLAENESLRKEILDLKHKIEKNQIAYDALVQRDLDTSSFAFDFKNDEVNAFSIERILYTDSWNKNVPKTVIGYILKSNPNETKEWSFYCNNVQHEKLVQQFNESRKIFECMP